MNKKTYAIIVLTTFFTQIPIWILTFLMGVREKYIFWALHGKSFDFLPLSALCYFKIYCIAIPVYLICNLIFCIVTLKREPKDNMYLALYVCISIFLTVLWGSFYWFSLSNLNQGVLFTGPLVPNDWTWGL